MALVLLLPLLMFLLAGLLVWMRQSEADRATETRLAAMVNVVAAQVRALVQTDLQLLEQFDANLGPDPAFFQSGAARSASLSSAAGLVTGGYVLVFDASGQLHLPDLNGVSPINVAERDYFRELEAGREWTISPMIIPEGDGEKVFAIGRRLVRNGAFVGAAVIYAPADFLAEEWADAQLGVGSALAVLRADGFMITRYPVPNEGEDLRDYVLFTDYLPKAPSGTYSAETSPVDGVARTISYRVVEGLPVVAVASIANDVLASGFWARILSMGAVAAPICVALMAVCVWLVVLLRRNEASHAALQAALDHNKMLFQEIHHRVKNNLQAVGAMIRLHPLPADVKEELTRRIGAMTIVHQHMYETDEFTKIEAADFLNKLLDSLQAGQSPGVKLESRLDPLLLPSEQAQALGLIVNEVVLNAYKHGFPDGAGGTIHVDLGVADGQARLMVRDTGAGFTPGGRTGMGSRLVTGLADQLGGAQRTVSDGPGQGALFTLTFPTA